MGCSSKLKSCLSKCVWVCVCVCAYPHTCSATQPCPTTCVPRDYSPPCFSVHGISQVRVLEWFPFPSPGDLPDPGIELMSLMSPALAGGFSTSMPSSKCGLMETARSSSTIQRAAAQTPSSLLTLFATCTSLDQSS